MSQKFIRINKEGSASQISVHVQNFQRTGGAFVELSTTSLKRFYVANLNRTFIIILHTHFLRYIEIPLQHGDSQDLYFMGRFFVLFF